MAEPRWLDAEEARAWRGYLRMRTLLDARIARDLQSDAGLSDPDYTVLSNLSEVEGRQWRLSDLAARMLWSTSRLSHHISRMQRRDLVIRTDSPDDGRGTIVALTDEGMRTIERAAPDHVESVRRHLLDVLTRQQIRALGEIGDTVVAHLTDG